MDGLMMDYQLNVPAIMRRADELYGDNEISSRLPDKSWHTYTYADFVSRTKKLVVALRKLGRRWQKLHRLVYVAGILAVVHFWWLVKADITEPRRWAVAIGSLLLFRVWWANRDRLSLRS